MKFTYQNITSQICFEISKNFVDRATPALNVIVGESKSLVEFVDRVQRMLLERRLSWVYASVLNGVFPDSGFIWCCAVLVTMPQPLQARVMAKWRADFSDAILLSNDDGAIRGVKFLLEKKESLFSKTGIGVYSSSSTNLQKQEVVDSFDNSLPPTPQEAAEDSSVVPNYSNNQTTKIFSKEEVSKELLK